MSDFGVTYFSHGTKHLTRLVTSLYSLRSVYDGPVTVFDTGESGGIMDRIRADQQLLVDIQKVKFVARKRHSCYCMKAGLWRESPYESTLFLDSDTVITKPLDQLQAIITDSNNAGFVVTRFSDWVTTGKAISNRLKQWHDVSVRGLDIGDALKRSLREVHPAINTGVFGFRRDARESLQAWEKLTAAGWECSFTDELAAQLIIRLFPHTLLADFFNHSVLYGTQPERAVVIHYHGSKHLRAEADGRWLAVYEHCIRENIGGIADWTPAGDPALTQYIADRAAKTA